MKECLTISVVREHWLLLSAGWHVASVASDRCHAWAIFSNSAFSEVAAEGMKVLDTRQ